MYLIPDDVVVEGFLKYLCADHFCCKPFGLLYDLRHRRGDPRSPVQCIDHQKQMDVIGHYNVFFQMYIRIALRYSENGPFNS